MPDILASPQPAARPRFRGAVTTLLLLLIAVMIVRDIFVRRWNTATSPVTDVTQRPR
jgi:hypothetical protein